jgi:hypothetical protein
MYPWWYSTALTNLRGSQAALRQTVAGGTLMQGQLII